jgi:hypothetical protein
VAVQTILVCDYCGQPAAETAGVRARGASWVIDLCADHLAEMMSHARRARPGRRPGSGSKASTSAPKTRARRKRATTKTAARRTRAKAAPPAEAEPAS